MLGGCWFGSVIPPRGLCKRDHCSPYLFLLCTESFSSMLQQAELEGVFPGVSICRGAPSISHLLFADDTLIFSSASSATSRAILDVLEIYPCLGVPWLAPFIPWRNLMAALPLFRSDVDGEWARIYNLAWLDPWLPRPYSFKPITTPPPTSDDIKVGIDDILVWYYSSSGLFTVRSVYHLICSLENSPGLNSLFVNEHAWWRFVWQAKVPNKIKVFIWKTCLNALPTSRNLLQRMPRSFSVCLHCKSEGEDVFHVLVSCPFVRNSKLMMGECLTADQVVCFATQYLDSFVAQNAGMGISPLPSVFCSWKRYMSSLVIKESGSATGEVAKALAAWEAIQLAARVDGNHSLSRETVLC
ncbi:hypothetical protein Sango_0649600 [Sesamum angolense]|uniref:Reverse transcriptase zinc-binding domain-containing protein n=1 Tax=Sesamum angolense TaxID=2727404 RepID=A0AAE2C2A5_9LAMI|nr:hypothetical protein Sango_0649600 [Sesamum angolense]